MTYSITSPTRRRNIRRAMDILKAEPSVSDHQILAAHEKGLEARENGMALADNPYVYRVLREAWLEGWYAGENH